MRSIRSRIIRKIKHRYAGLSRRQKLIAAAFSLLLFSGTIFTLAELGGYGQNGPDTAPNSLDYGLIGYWNFEEGGGQTVYDKSGNNNNATLGSSSSADSSDPVFAPGHDASGENGTGMQFDGADDYAINTSFTHNFSQGFSESMWFLRETNTIQGLAEIRTSTGNQYRVFFSSADRIEFDFNPGEIGNVHGATRLGEWMHVAVTYTPTTASIYINGVLAEQATADFALPATTANICLGSLSLGTGPFMDGFLDEVRVYDRALSEDEIRMLYNQKKPVAEYKFDEGSGTVAHDESFNDNDGTIFGGATWVDGKSGTALSFDGTDDYVDAGNGSSLAFTPTQPVTISSWFKLNADGYDSFLSQPIVSTKYVRIVARMSSNIIQVRTDDSVTARSASFALGTGDRGWHHVVGTYSHDGTNEIIKIYIDGVLRQTTTVASTPTASYLNQIGAFQSGRFSGLIDSVRIYNYARTPDEVLADYNDGKAAHLGKNNQDLNYGLVGYWNFEEGGGQTLYDKSGNGNDATLGSSSSADSSDPVFGPGHDSAGENGTGVIFDGANDYAGAGDVLDMRTGDMTVSAWVKTNVTDRRQFFISKSRAASQNYRYGVAVDNGKAQIFMQGNGGADVVVVGNISVADDKWHYISAIYDRDGNASIYVDGVYDTGSAISQWNGVDMNSDNPFRIGSYTASDNTTPYWFFQGSLDEVRIYNRALSEDEIRMLYNQKKPILEMKFDEGSGTVAHDESFNDNDGTIYGATWADGKSGTALSFDGTDDYISAADSAIYDTGNRLTVSTWFKTSTAQTERGMVMHDDSEYKYLLYITSNSTVLSFYVRTASGIKFVSTTAASPYADGEWRHVTGVYDRYAADGYRLKIYVNGVLAGQDAGYDEPIAEGDEGIHIGRYGGGGCFNGSLDSVRIYNYARTADEVLADYNDGKAAHLGKNNQDLNYGLVGYWNFEEGGGQTVYDRSGNGNNGTLGSTSGTDANDPAFGSGHDSSGVIGKGMVFDGEEEYMDAGNGSSLDITDKFTIFGWFKLNSNINSSITTNKVLIKLKNWAKIDFMMGNGRLYLHDAAGLSDTNIEFSSQTNWSAGQWINFAMTYDSSASSPQQKMYLNGVISRTQDNSGALTTSTSNFWLGYPASANADAFDGTLDEIRIYNRALSEDEIRMLYNQKKPIFEMKFEEGAGATAYDESFNNNDGTIYGATWVDGKSGTALSFDGTDDYLIVNDNYGLNLTADYSISMWVYNRAGAKNYPTFLNREPQSGTNGFFWIYTTGVNETDINFQYANGSSYVGTTFVGALGLNSWSHLIFTFENSSKSLKLFVNGQQFSTTRTLTGALPVDGGNLYLGTYQGSATNYNFYGYLDDVRIYNYARTPDEVLADYNSGKAAHLR